MEITAEAVKKFAFAQGANLVGIAPADRLADAPEGHRPWDILKQARSVVACGLAIPGGVLEGPATIYQGAMTSIHARLDALAGQIALGLESKGGKAVPIPADEPYQHWEPERMYGRGDLSHKHAAVAAGLGNLGKNSLLIAPGFGNRVHLVSIVTDVTLAPDRILDWEPCPVSCTQCLKACPAKALNENGMVDQSRCRLILMQRLPKGTVVESCWACRLACRAGLTEQPE